MISRMITSLTSAHAIFTEARFTERIAGVRALKFSEVCPFLSAQLGIELSIEDQLEVAGMILAIQSLHQCPDHRIFEFAHVLYHMCEEVH
jgi:hypothetical protein